MVSGAVFLTEPLGQSFPASHAVFLHTLPSASSSLFREARIGTVLIWLPARLFRARSAAAFFSLIRVFISRKDKDNVTDINVQQTSYFCNLQFLSFLLILHDVMQLPQREKKCTHMLRVTISQKTKVFKTCNSLALISGTPPRPATAKDFEETWKPSE